MISKRQLAVIWIAIVTIALQLLPATAMAHGGHAHVPGSIAITAHDHPTGNATQVNAAQANLEHAGPIAGVAAVGVAASWTAPSGTCSDGCCASGFSCCVPAILSEALLGLPSRLNAIKVTRPGTSMRAGIDPEALPKPPKSST